MMYDAVVIGASAGGLNALKTLLSELPKNFPASVFIVQHLSPNKESYMVEYLKDNISLPIKEAGSMDPIIRPMIYVAPPNYHMLIDRGDVIVLSVEGKVNYSRPSIDLLFSSAAERYREKLIGIILTGANSDGSDGLKRIHELGGIAIIQSLSDSEASAMPQAAMLKTNADYILDLKDMSKIINRLIHE